MKDKRRRKKKQAPRLLEKFVGKRHPALEHPETGAGLERNLRDLARAGWGPFV